jgi:MATE family multidrug resistance protein
MYYYFKKSAMRLTSSYGDFYSLEIWYNTVLILLTGNMKNAEIAIDALAIW